MVSPLNYQVPMKKALTTQRWTILSALLLALSLQACSPKQESQEDCGFVQNVYGQRISWKSSVPINLYLHKDYPDNMIQPLKSAIAVWEQDAGRKLFELNVDDRAGGDPAQDRRNVIFWMGSWEADKSAEQARTSVYWLGSTIYEADIRINDAYFDFYDETPSSNREIHLQSLLIHELGHVLGMKHKDSDNSVMATYLSSLTQRKQIPESDISNIRCEY